MYLLAWAVGAASPYYHRDSRPSKPAASHRTTPGARRHLGARPLAGGGPTAQRQVMDLLSSGKGAFSVSEGRAVANFLARQKDLLILAAKTPDADER